MQIKKKPILKKIMIKLKNKNDFNILKAQFYKYFLLFYKAHNKVACFNVVII